MPININKFVPRPGLVNQQGLLPDPSELVHIEVPKVFDQCLIKRCLVYGEGPDTKTTDQELRSNPLDNPKRYINSTDFKIRLISLEKIPIRGKPNFKKLVLEYMISFYANYIDCDGVNQSELYEINRTDVIGRFNCPDSLVQISGTYIGSHKDKNEETNIIKLEMVAEALDGKLVQDEDCNYVLDITLGYFIVIKCQIMVQLLVPAYHYCPDLKECEEVRDEDPCEIFNKSSIPQFYPVKSLDPLFPELKGDSSFIKEIIDSDAKLDKL